MPARNLLPPQDAGDAATDRLRFDVREFLAQWSAEGGHRPRIDGWVHGWDPGLSAALAEHGWVGMAIPEQYGGRGRSPLERHVVAEELLRWGAPVAYHWFADRQIAPALLRYGTEDQRRRYLPAIAAGRQSFALGLSEPDAGSDLASVRTRARRVSGGWRLAGTKIWTSNAHRADAMTVLARTAESADVPRHEALSQFVVELPDPAATAHPIRQLGGGHHFNEVHLDDVFVPDAQVLGSIGQGWQQVTSELAWERSGPERLLSTYPLFAAVLAGEAPESGVAADIGSVYAGIWATHHLSLRVAAALTRGETPSVAAALVKDLGTALENDIIGLGWTADAVRAGAGETELSRLLREATLAAPGFTLRGGSTEVLRGIVAKELVRR